MPTSSSLSAATSMAWVLLWASLLAASAWVMASRAFWDSSCAEIERASAFLMPSIREAIIFFREVLSIFTSPPKRSSSMGCSRLPSAMISAVLAR